MSGPRHPDPTLDDHDGAVLVADGGPGLPVAHRWNLGDHGPACGAEAVKMLRSCDAAYFAVPCGDDGCFPDAPPPGRKYATSNEDRWFAIYVEQVDPADGPLTVSGPYLGWQRPAEVAS